MFLNPVKSNKYLPTRQRRILTCALWHHYTLPRAQVHLVGVTKNLPELLLRYESQGHDFIGL